MVTALRCASGPCESRAFHFEADLGRTQQGVVNQAMMDGLFDALFVFFRELRGNIYRDPKVRDRRR